MNERRWIRVNPETDRDVRLVDAAEVVGIDAERTFQPTNGWSVYLHTRGSDFRLYARWVETDAELEGFLSLFAASLSDGGTP